MILITTAGKVGSEAARQLAQRGQPVRVVVRSPEKATVLRDTSFATNPTVASWPASAAADYPVSSEAVTRAASFGRSDRRADVCDSA